jgi:hypothetical protein
VNKLWGESAWLAGYKIGAASYAAKRAGKAFFPGWGGESESDKGFAAGWAAEAHYASRIGAESYHWLKEAA